MTSLTISFQTVQTISHFKTPLLFGFRALKKQLLVVQVTVKGTAPNMNDHSFRICDINLTDLLYFRIPFFALEYGRSLTLV